MRATSESRRAGTGVSTGGYGVIPAGYRAYQKAKVETSTPQRLIILLFKEACVSTEIGIQAVREKDYETAHKRLLKAQDIVTELMGALDLRIPLAENLFRIYDYIHNLLVTGNLKKDVAPLEEALKFLKELRETWTEAVQKAEMEATAASLRGGVTVGR